MNNLRIIPNNILTNFFKESTKYKCKNKKTGKRTPLGLPPKQRLCLLLLDCVSYRSIQQPIGKGWRGTNFLYHSITDQAHWYWSELWKSLTIPPSQCGSNDSNLWPGSDTICQIVCLTDPSNDQLVKDEGAQIFYSIRSQTKPISSGANCENLS